MAGGAVGGTGGVVPAGGLASGGGGGWAANISLFAADAVGASKELFQALTTFSNNGAGLTSVSQMVWKFLKSGVGKVTAFTFTADSLALASLTAQVLFGPDNWVIRGGNGNLKVVSNSDFAFETVATGANATTATRGFVQIKSCGGKPTGVPAAMEVGNVGLVADTLDGKLFFTTAGGLYVSCGDDFSQGAALSDLNLTRGLSNGSEFGLPNATLSANRTLTLDTTGTPATGEIIRVNRLDSNAFTYAIINGGPGAGTKLTFAASVRAAADFKFDGTNWQLDRVWRLN